MDLREEQTTKKSSTQQPQVANEELVLTAPGKLRVIKRNGKVVAFEEDKIKVAVTKAFLAMESGNAAASERIHTKVNDITGCLLYTSPSPRDATLSRMPSSA